MCEETSSKLSLGYTLELVGDPGVVGLRRGGEVVVTRFTHNVDPKEIRRTGKEFIEVRFCYRNAPQRTRGSIAE